MTLPEASHPVAATYNFHGIFRLCVRCHDPKVLRHFDAEYGLFLDHTRQPADLELIVGQFDIAPDGDSRVIGEYRAVGPWIMSAQRYKVARWRYALAGLHEATTRLHVQGSFFSLDFIQKYLVEQIMRYKISQKGYVLLHAGCVARDGQSVLFPGLGHAGKTQLALQQVLGGWRYQSDDYTFVSEEGHTYCYPRRIHLSDNVGATGPAGVSPLSGRHRLSMAAKKLAFWLSLGYGNLTEALQLHELVPGGIIENTAHLQAVLILASTLTSGSKPPRRLGAGELLDRVLAINFLEAPPFHALLLSAQCVDPGISASAWWRRERDILQSALRGRQAYEISVPYRALGPTQALQRAGSLMEQAVTRAQFPNRIRPQGVKQV